MSSEAAQKAYDEIQWMTMTELLRNAFDRGAVEALRQAADKIQDLADSLDEHVTVDDVYAQLTDLAAEIHEWVVGQ